ncbi:MAG: ABC-F family ATP-binding cassette domain-containing protein [Helicobacteraceae bacterium]|nr:ABC-F family ATP-binding cassette domain-containing protein [Helicobacteraceae bacterium]
MPLVDLKEITKQFDNNTILNNVEFTIETGERAAVVGKNGSGKSTLMKIVAGTLEADSGSRMAQKALTIETLDQSPALDEALSVREAIENSLSTLSLAKSEYEALSRQLEENQDSQTLSRITALVNLLDFHNAWDLTAQVECVLTKFELKALENAKICTLSGGEKRRVALGILILKKPALLLLDEPTNHLDVYMVRFLEETLLESRSTLLIISHDRYFIDRIATRIVEVEDGTLRSFRGGYMSYLEQKTSILENMIKSHETLVKRLRGEIEWLNRGVKARLKRNVGRVEKIKLMKEEAKKNPSIIRKIKLELEREQKAFSRKESINKKKILFELQNVSIGIDKKVLIKPFSARVTQQEKIAITGRNGSGKTTLLRSLIGFNKPLFGTIDKKIDTIGYFDQHRLMLDDSKTLLETFCPNGGDHIEVQGRSIHVYGYMKSWIFPKEFLDKKIGILSGGEKNRVALALLLSKKYDCLFLDEPTNDLDIPTINIMEEYLRSFLGALIFVSHDRYFVDKIAQKLWIINPDQTITERYQSYSDFLDDEAIIQKIEEISTDKAHNDRREEKRQSFKLSYKEQKLLEQLPLLIEQQEREVKELESAICSPVFDRGELIRISEQLSMIKTSLEENVNCYLTLEEKKESYAS